MAAPDLTAVRAQLHERLDAWTPPAGADPKEVADLKAELGHLIDNYPAVPGQSLDSAVAGLQSQFQDKVHDFGQDLKLDALLDAQKDDAPTSTTTTGTTTTGTTDPNATTTGATDPSATTTTTGTTTTTTPPTGTTGTGTTDPNATTTTPPMTGDTTTTPPMSGDTGTTPTGDAGSTTTGTDTGTATATPPPAGDTGTAQAPPTEPPTSDGPRIDMPEAVRDYAAQADEATEAPAGFEPRIGQEFGPDAGSGEAAAAAASSTSSLFDPSNPDSPAFDPATRLAGAAQDTADAASGLVDEFDVAATSGVQADMSGADVGYIADPAPGSGGDAGDWSMPDLVGDVQTADMSAQWEPQPMTDTAMPDPSVTMTFDDLQPADEPQNTGIVPPQFLEDAQPDVPADDFQYNADDDDAGTDDSTPTAEWQ